MKIGAARLGSLARNVDHNSFNLTVMPFVGVGIVAQVTILSTGFRNPAQLVNAANTCQKKRVQNE